jgi:hypothetical protein
MLLLPVFFSALLALSESPYAGLMLSHSS